MWQTRVGAQPGSAPEAHCACTSPNTSFAQMLACSAESGACGMLTSPSKHPDLRLALGRARRRMRLKRNYKFVRYQDSARAQPPAEPAAAAAPEPALQTRLSLPGTRLTSG